MVEMYHLEITQKEKSIVSENFGNVSFTLNENMYLVENLKHNLLSISQLCDKGIKLFSIKIDVLLRMHMMARFCL